MRKEIQSLASGKSLIADQDEIWTTNTMKLYAALYRMVERDAGKIGLCS